MLRACLKVARTGVGRFPFSLRRDQTGWVEHDADQREVESLAERLRSLGVPVRMPGFILRRDVPGQFRRAHIHVTPSRWEEPFGIVTLEAMASGLATCASARGTPEFLGNAGLLFEKDDVDGLAAHLDRLDSRRRDPQRPAREAGPGGNVPVGPRVAWLHGVYPSVMALSQAIVVPIQALCLRHPWFLLNVRTIPSRRLIAGRLVRGCGNSAG